MQTLRRLWAAALAPLAVLGLVILTTGQGAGGGGGGGDGGSSGDGGDGTGGSDDGGDDPPPTTAEQLAELRAQQIATARDLKKARGEVDHWKRKAEGGRDGEDVDARVKREREEARAEGRQEADGTWGPRYKLAMVRAALAGAGAKAAQRAARLVDLDALEVDEDTGDVTGLDDEVKRVKKELPELFRPGPGDGGSTGHGDGGKKTTSERLMEKLAPGG